MPIQKKSFANRTLLVSTKGGAGGTVTTVSTLAEFTAAVNEKNSEPAIVVVNGIISGNEKVRVGSNKSIIGLPGSGEAAFIDPKGEGLELTTVQDSRVSVFTSGARAT